MVVVGGDNLAAGVTTGTYGGSHWCQAPSSRKKVKDITGVQVAEFGKLCLTGSNQFGY